MLCEKCQTAEAVVFLTRVINDEMTKLSLCEKCAREMSVSVTGFNLAKLLLKGAALAMDDNEPPLTCAMCGVSEEHLRKAGLLGCPQCYETFAALLEETVRDTQRASLHVGKVPRHRAADRQTLEQELTVAVREENYELAAQLRDRLRKERSLS